MSLDVYLEAVKPTEVYWRNITHNLGSMAGEAGMYQALWRPEEIGAEKAKDIVPILRDGIGAMESDPERFKKFNPENGWGDYEGLLDFARDYLKACLENPEATIRISR